jgi:hypothetical protein
MGQRTKTEVARGTRARLQAAARAVADAREVLRTEQDRRDALIVQAVDIEGISQHQVARDAGLAQPSIQRILGESQPHARLETPPG